MLAIEVLRNTELMNDQNKSTNTTSISDVTNTSRIKGDTMNNLNDIYPQGSPKNIQGKQTRKKKPGLYMSLKLHNYKKMIKCGINFFFHIGFILGVRHVGKYWFKRWLN
jgi:hypothetical protein